MGDASTGARLDQHGGAGRRVTAGLVVIVEPHEPLAVGLLEQRKQDRRVAREAILRPKNARVDVLQLVTDDLRRPRDRNAFARRLAGIIDQKVVAGIREQALLARKQGLAAVCKGQGFQLRFSRTRCDQHQQSCAPHHLVFISVVRSSPDLIMDYNASSGLPRSTL